MPKKYDLLVIGGGSGGLAHAQRAAEYGASVAIIEQALIGGTCVNVGCVPKKLMHYTALIGSMKKDGEYFGWNSTSKVREDATFNWEKLVKYIGNHIRMSIRMSIRKNIREHIRNNIQKLF